MVRQRKRAMPEKPENHKFDMRAVTEQGWKLPGQPPDHEASEGSVSPGQRGVSLLAVIFVILVLSAVGYTFTAIMAAKQRAVPPTLDAGRAFYIAEGGTQFAGIYLKNLASWAAASNQTRSLGGGSFTVTFSSYSSGGGVESITCTSTGTYGAGQRVLLVTFQRYL
jgi:hypothetical protein